jgi:flagellar biogenesis protein FliO
LFFNCSGRVTPGLSPKSWTKGRFRHSGAQGTEEETRMTIVWILIVIILVLLAIYLFRRVV